MPPVASKLMSWQLFSVISWWRHQMETFSALLAICAGNSPVPGEFPAQRPVTRSFDVSFDLRLNKRLSKQSWGWWFETLSRPLWRHRNNVANALGWVGLWGKTTMGPALGGAVLDFTQILDYLVHNMSRSQLYLGFGHFGWLPSFSGQEHFCGFMFKLYFIFWNYSLSSGWPIIAA